MDLTSLKKLSEKDIEKLSKEELIELLESVEFDGSLKDDSHVQYISVDTVVKL